MESDVPRGIWRSEMQFKLLKEIVLATCTLAFTGLVVSMSGPAATAQSAVTGAVSGLVTDATGAVVPNATVIVQNVGTDARIKLVTNAEGRYVAPQLAPGTYKISATTTGMQSETLQVAVLVGTTVPGDIKVTPTGDKTVVEVSSTSLPLVDTQNVALATTFNEQQIQELPTPGGDVTTVAFTAPGVVVNSGGAYGNFSAEGLPGISNLFVLNGFDNQDPFLNLNNSGSSNLTLGQGELEEATVVMNGYNSQYGRAAGAIIQYTTKSGTNSFHGMADYNYNGTVMNANGWFNNYYGAARPHAVSNEWALNAGGPIIRDKVFFFADWEGLRYVLPGAAGLVNYPSAQFQAATLATIPANSVSLYNTAFKAYQGAPSYKSAQPLATGGTVMGGCGDVAGTPVPGGGTFGADTPCMTEAFAQTNNINKEWLFTGRGDWSITDNHKIYGRYKMDRGSQPTSTSFINPLFSTVSIQPEYEGQFNDSYVISPTKTNVFVAASNWYSAYFGPQDVAAADAAYPWSAFPDIGLDGSGISASPGLTGLGVPDVFPQGRNVTQYQLEDDFSWIHGQHALKFGANFRRDLVSDYDSQVLTDFPLQENLDLGTFYAGGSFVFVQNFTNVLTAHLALYNVGMYAQDEWQATPRLKLTIGARVDRTGDPLCHGGCFSAYTGTFPSTAASLTQPYMKSAGGSINPQNGNAFPTIETINFQPRFGINFAVNDKTEVRAGVGIFSDLYPAFFVDGAIQNFPNVNTVQLFGGTAATAGSGAVTLNAAAANAALQSGFTSGQNLTQINNTLTAAGVPFTPPSINAYFPGKFQVPEYAEYSLQLQRKLGTHDAITLTYAGNKGYHGVLLNPYLNGSSGSYDNATGKWALNPAVSAPIGGTAITPPDPSFSRITSYTNGGHSNYNGGMVTFKHTGYGLTGQMSYTWSHSLDMVSNGGEGLPFNGGSVGAQLTPSLGIGNLNYSNSDYDIRNNLVGDLVYEEPYKASNPVLREVLGGWVLGAKTYYRGGEPFTIANAALSGDGFTNLGGIFMVQSKGGVTKLTNSSASNPESCLPNSNATCLDPTQFVAPGAQTGFGNIRRNALYGPHYANTDLSLLKKVYSRERLTFQVGANAFNAFNHANFAAPAAALGSTFGIITGTVAPPTSPYGSFQGAAVTQRVLQVHGKFTF